MIHPPSKKTTCKWNMGGEQYYTFQKFCASKGWLFLAAAKKHPASEMPLKSLEELFRKTVESCHPFCTICSL